MANNINNDAQLQRMKALMTYGINESKQPEYSTVEYNKVAADGKLYGIVREGTQYYIKVAKDNKAKLVSENFDYIGGFRNRKDNCFESFASAQRYFGEKMININESVELDQKKVIAENYINEKKDVIAEQTEKMQQEIARQRQIMENAQNIMEKKEQNCCPVKGKDAEKNSESPKCDAKDCKAAVDYHGKPIKKTPSAPFTETPKMVKESAETPLSSRENPDYMDKSHGTKIGNNAPFAKPVEKTENAVADENGGEAEQSHLTEGESMHDTDNQNSPAPGVGEKGDNAPFEKTVNESLEDMDDTLDDDVEGDEFDTDIEDDVEGDEDFDIEGDEDMDVEPVDGVDSMDADVEGSDIEGRLGNLEDMMRQILDAMNNMKYDDDDELYDDDDELYDDDDELYDDEEEEPADEEGDTDYELEMDDDMPEEEMPEEEEDDEDINVVESRSFRAMKARLMNEENRLDDFGKHPAYQKKVMTLPANNNFKKDGQYDMNDSSVDGEQPYGTQKGDFAPFNVNREEVTNEITESVFRKLKKKLG